MKTNWQKSLFAAGKSIKTEGNDYRVVIPISEIRTARPFDMAVYDQFQRHEKTRSGGKQRG